MFFTKKVSVCCLLAALCLLAACGAPGVTPTLIPVPGATVTGAAATPGAPGSAVPTAPSTGAPTTVAPATVAPTAVPPTPSLAAPAPSATAVPATATTAPTTSSSSPTAIPPKDVSRVDPLLMLAAYFDAISRKDYHAAAAYLVREGDATPDAAAATKVAQKYAGLGLVMPVVNPLYGVEGAAGSLYASIPALLVMTKTAGGQRYMAGCIVARHAQAGNFDPPRDTGWHVYSESLSDTPSANANLLAQGCQTTPPPSSTDDRSNPVQLLASLYDAINRKEYPRAYAYWESPPAGATEPQFAAGYVDTVSVLVGVRPPIRYDGAAGSQYAPLPAILISQHTDQSKAVFVGCYTARRVNPAIGGPGADSGWHIYSGKFSPAAGNSPNAAVLATTTCP